MSRPCEGIDRKIVVSITIDRELAQELKEECHVSNLSGWLNEKIREEVVGKRSALECPNCHAIMGYAGWRTRKYACPQCSKVFPEGAGLNRVNVRESV